VVVVPVVVAAVVVAVVVAVVAASVAVVVGVPAMTAVSIVIIRGTTAQPRPAQNQISTAFL